MDFSKTFSYSLTKNKSEIVEADFNLAASGHCVAPI